MVRIQSPSGDPLRHREFKRSDFKPTNQAFEYKPYKPTTVGIYGEKQPEEKKYSKSSKPTKQPRVRKPKTTFECYSDPKGPDIKVGNIGPDYKVTKYEYTEFKPEPVSFDRTRLSSPKDPLKSKPVHFGQPVGIYKGDVNYKLTKDNNAAMRHWNYGFVDDTVAAKGSNTKPREKYKEKETPKPAKEYRKPVEAKPEQRPAVAAVAPVQKVKSPPPPLPPVTKSYKTSSTQHVSPGVKTITTQTQGSKTKSFGTQYEPEKKKTMSVQTEASSSPLPAIAPAPIPLSPKKVSTKSLGIQCSESMTQTVGKGTQSDRPRVREMNTQTSPTMVAIPQQAPAQARAITPQYAEQAKQETPVYRRNSPPPKIVPVVATIPKRQSPVKQRTPTQSPVKKRTPTPEKTYTQTSDTRWTPSPEVVQVIPTNESSNITPQLYQQSSPKNTPVIRESPKSVAFRAPSPTKPKQYSESPKVFIPPYEQKPVVTSYPEYSAAQQSPYKSGQGMFPYQPAQSRLPPEVTACIEAYDMVHGPT